MKKIIISFILICLLINCFFLKKNYAYERNDHDQITLEILFEGDVKKRVEETISWKMLTSAAYLAIDQYNGHGEKDLQLLKNNKVKNLPESIVKIDYKASSNHRKDTHRGWNFKYPINEVNERWKIRKNILINTVRKVFDFNNPVYSENKNEKQLDGFCQLLYYLHILEDHLEAKKFTKNDLIISISLPNDDLTVLKQLIVEVLPKTFPNQKHTLTYQNLERKLRQIDIDISKLVTTKGGINDKEKFSSYKLNVEKIKSILSYYLPFLLHEEPFFRNVFY